MSKPYGSETFDLEVNKRDGRAYQEPLGASTVEAAGDNELLNGCLGTRVNQVIPAAQIASQASLGLYSMVALGTKAVGMTSGGTEGVAYFVEATASAAAGDPGVIDTNDWTWTPGAGSDYILGNVEAGDRAWAGILVA